jgi:K+-sensing histidine kinase KdpD
MFLATLAFVAFGIPAILTFLLSHWLDDRVETEVEPKVHEPATGVGVSRAPFMESPASYAVAIICVAIAWGIRQALDPYLLAYLPFTTFYLAISIAGWLGGFGPAVLAIALSTVVGRYFFMSPLHELTMDSVLTAVSISTFVLVSLFLATMTSMLHAALRRIEQLTSAPESDVLATNASTPTPVPQRARSDAN